MTPQVFSGSGVSLTAAEVAGTGPDVDFLHRNGRLLGADGQSVINDIGLAALALPVAESDPAQKDSLIRLIMNMLAGANEGGRA